MASTSSFPPTRWTLVIRAGQGDQEGADRALEELCRAYWYPVYAFIRRAGNPPDLAQDLAQDFFVRFLEKRHVAFADPAKGRFRSFLLVSVKRFLIDQAERRSAEKRGGHIQFTAPEWDGKEERYTAGISTSETPESLFEREWAQTLIARVTMDTRAALERECRTRVFDRLKEYLPGGDEALPYPVLAFELNTSENALRVAFHRLRRRYRELFRAEIAQLVEDPNQIDDEVLHLLRVLRG
jgi:DNA-directed RNA polymerase specialized sigma24 family protein